MRLRHEQESNQRNAAASSGPKSAAGKAALRHGLAIPIWADRALATARANPSTYAQIDVLRIRRAGGGGVGAPDGRCECQSRQSIATKTALFHDATARSAPSTPRVYCTPKGALTLHYLPDKSAHSHILN